MSTSKNWVVWIADFVDKFDPDLLRYYLTINAPLNKDTDFSWMISREETMMNWQML